MGILKSNEPEGKILAIDFDIEMIKRVIIRVSNLDLKDRLILEQGNFADLKKIVEKHKFKKIAGILLDIGMSSYHIDESVGGFSFRKEEDLDMRYDRSSGLITAGEIVNTYSVDDLERIFKEYGEERFSRAISKKIIETRKSGPIKTTRDLVNVIKWAIPRKYQHGRIHFATRVFQALRIETNREIENLKSVLPQAVDILETGGRLVLISFHSLEDREVKHFFKNQANENKIKILTKKPARPSLEEIKNNPRARSAKLRAVVKI